MQFLVCTFAITIVKQWRAQGLECADSPDLRLFAVFLFCSPGLKRFKGSVAGQLCPRPTGSLALEASNDLMFWGWRSAAKHMAEDERRRLKQEPRWCRGNLRAVLMALGIGNDPRNGAMSLNGAILMGTLFTALSGAKPFFLRVLRASIFTKR